MRSKDKKGVSLQNQGTMSVPLFDRFRLAGKATLGLFLTDQKRTVAGRVWQLFSRFTWELPQTIVGWLFTLGRIFAGKVEQVVTLGGITFALGPTKDNGMGVSLGTFVDAWLGSWMRAEKEGRVTDSQFLMHEFGHTADSQRFGWAYLPVIGLPSLLSAFGKGDHDSFWTETRANRHAKRYFSKHYAIVWNEKGYPIDHPSAPFQV